MKNIKIIAGLAVLLVAFSSCKDEKEVQAQKKIDSYVAYVDSVKNVKADELKAGWKDINAEYDRRAEEARLALADLKDNTKETERLNTSKTRYEEFKNEMDALFAPPITPRQKMRNTLFGEGRVGDDMNFSWVNANNILSVYDQFVNTVQDNKDSYSREDWDEIKMMYEALDSRKNTVEKEGLTSEDNLKIAGLKLKFAPMYRINRIGAKSDENAAAKK
jgi:hypothetical protein